MSSNLRLGASIGRRAAVVDEGGIVGAGWSRRTRWCRLPAAFWRRSSRALLPRMDSKSVCTIFATSQTFETSLRACMQMLIRSWLRETTLGTDERIWYTCMIRAENKLYTLFWKKKTG